MSQQFSLTSASITDRGLSEKRPQNEDSFLDVVSRGIFAVADGVGGAEAGEVASQMAMEVLGEAFANMLPDADAETVMRMALEQANSAIHQMATELPQLSQMATTVVALHISGNIATIGHAGDSRLYCLNSRGQLLRETEDHSMVADEVRAGRLTEEQAENHPGKNIINRALGAESTVDIELKTKIIDDNRTYLLCSDGVTRHIADAELAVILSEPDIVAICTQIKQICFDRGAEDNLTAVAVRLSSETSDADLEATLPLMLEDDELATVASARNSSSEVDDDDLLELDTLDMDLSTVAGVRTELSEGLSAQQGEDLHEAEHVVERSAPEIGREQIAELLVDASGIEQAEDANAVNVSVPDASTQAEAVRAPEYPISAPETIFGSDGTDHGSERRGISTLLAAIGSLVLGAAIGIGVYHFLLLPSRAPATPELGEMRSPNIPLTAFEENRRNVDRDPNGYIQKQVPPEDAEDYYLLGRAYLLVGDYPKAHNALIEARSRLKGADPANAGIMANDIAISLVVTNDTTIQTMLKKELDSAKPGAEAKPSPPVNR